MGVSLGTIFVFPGQSAVVLHIGRLRFRMIKDRYIALGKTNGIYNDLYFNIQFHEFLHCFRPGPSFFYRRNIHTL